MKGLIIAGGNGTRLAPFTNVVNKHLLPVGRQPMIYWPLMKLKEAGLKEIAIVTMEKDLSDFILMLGDGSKYGLTLHYFMQKKADGIADAIRCAESFIQNERIVVLLGDNLFSAPLSPYIDTYKQVEQGAMVLLKEVADPSSFAVATVDEAKGKIISIVEKPQMPMDSNLCVTGIYFFDEQLLDIIRSMKRSDRQEFEVTDINHAYAKKNELYYRHLEGWWLDAGTHESLFAANERMHRWKDRGDLI